VRLGVDTNGLPHAVRVTTADVTDRDGAVETLRSRAPNLSKVAKVLCNGGYSGENFANAVREALINSSVCPFYGVKMQKHTLKTDFRGFNQCCLRALIGAEVEVVKRNEPHRFAVLPKRWVVERTFGWLEKYRRLWKNRERKIHSTLQMTFLRLPHYF
jgi:transposase